MIQNKKNNLGYLGEDFQWKLVKILIEDKKFFLDIVDVVDQNMFNDEYLRQTVATLKNYHEKYASVCSYEQLTIEMKYKVRDEIDLKFIEDTIERIKKSSFEGFDSVKEKATKFFKQQNLVKAINQISEIINKGDIDEYDECVDIITKATSSGNREDLGERLYDDVGDVLSDDYRDAVPTGIKSIDESLEGGVGKGEIGVIIGPSSFGKTSLTTAIASYNASHGKKVIQIFFEDRAKQIKRKHFAYISKVESRNISKEEHIDYVKEKIFNEETKRQYTENLLLKKFEDGEVTPNGLRTYLTKVINSGFIPDLVIIDYFECLSTSKHYNDPYQGEGEIMRQLVTIANDFNVALWVPTQGTKDSLGAQLVTMDKAGGSFKKIQKAFIVMSITRSIEDIEDNIATISILKNRSGKSGKIISNVYFNNGTCEIDTEKSIIIENSEEAKKYQEKLEEQIVIEALKNKKNKKNDKEDISF